MELGRLTRLQGLALDNNQLTGEIPDTLGNLDNLRNLSLYGNQLTGEIPLELGRLTRLQFLWLDDNQLTGKISAILGNLGNLRELSLDYNQLAGEIPSELGNLSNLEWLSLDENQLTGEIPPEFGNLSNLENLVLKTNQLTGQIPSELGNLSNLDILDLKENPLTGRIPRSFLQLKKLGSLTLPDGVCAPQDDEFQRWLSAFSDVDVAGCAGISFASGIDNQSYPHAQTIPPLILPEATAGVPPVTYTLTPPELLQGLRFDEATRTISGIPTEITPPVMFTYTATDAQNSQDSLRFSIEVYPPVSAEQDAPLPTEFAVRSSYPNPFRYSIRFRLDLPWPARVGVTVLDMAGRQVFTQVPIDLPAGSEQEVILHGMTLSSGVYLYRLTADSAEERSVHVGHFVRIR